ncbi:TetR/AcrR family transcriptional regulator [Streptococcus mutans]|uniref:TetR/AcrR family transcriptional regulator n=1 Tax=Streptococcus mutans TaxID=1309 RepID=UPI0022841426|nr:TetR/AcrR family transcriptional regulator [Streptococcus mutans]MCY7118324.1 TetR/AcrR family transcriptional regulator [Streptococcus mutans]
MTSRVYASKKVIADTFFKKLEKDNFNAITISEIVGEANLSRSTFYRYFKNKYSIVQFFIEDLLDAYLLAVDEREIEDFTSLLVIYFEFWKKNKYYLELFKRHNLLVFALDIERKKFLKVLPYSDLPWHHNSSENELFADLIVIGGVWNISLYWLENDFQLEPVDLAEEIVKSLSSYKIFI